MTMIRLCLVFLSFTFVMPVTSAAKAIEPLRKRVGGETAVEEPTWFCIYKLKAEKVWKTFKTPGYPKTLDLKQSRCTWKISAPGKMSIRVAFRGIGLIAEDPDHCSSNYLEMIDEVLGKSQTRLCGRKTAGDIVSQGNKLRLDLQRDPSEIHQRGFSISYMATKGKPGFYAKKTFNDKTLPPMKRKQPESSDREDTTTKKKKDATKKSDSGVLLINQHRQLIQGHQKKRQLNTNSGFKRIDSSEATTSGGMSILVIVGIVIGGLVGVLIIVLLFRKLFMNKNSKDKEKEQKEIAQENSGLPKVDMTHEKVVNAKRNILAPNVIVARNQNRFPQTEPEHLPQNTSRWSSSDGHASDPPPNYRKTNHSAVNQSNAIRRNSSYKQNKRYGNGVTNRTYEHDVPRKKIPENIPPRPNRDRGGSSKRSPSLSPRKIPYRYNSNRNPSHEQKRAIEDLNNEQFCEYGTTYTPHLLQQSPSKAAGREKQTRGRRTIQVRRIPGGNSSDSDLTDVFSPESPTRKLKSLKSFSQDIYRRNELPEICDKGRQTRLKAGVSKTLDIREISTVDKKPVKRRSTIGESRGQPGRDFQVVNRQPKSKKKHANLDEEDCNLNGMLRTRSRFDAPPSPSLPRHVVPSSRGRV